MSNNGGSGVAVNGTELGVISLYPRFRLPKLRLEGNLPDIGLTGYKRGNALNNAGNVPACAYNKSFHDRPLQTAVNTLPQRQDGLGYFPRKRHVLLKLGVN